MKRNVTAAEDIDRITKVMPKNIARDADHHIAQIVQHHDTATGIIHSMKKKDSLNMTHLYSGTMKTHHNHRLILR
jgi:hypothetical protein